MMRKIMLPILVLMLLSMACSFGGGGNSPAAPTNTAAVQVEPVQPTDPPQPTDTEAPTEAPQPTDTEAPTEAPQPTDTETGPIEYTETFERDNEDWSEDIIVTTQTSGRDLDSKATISNGIMNIRLGDKETYMYKFFLYTTEGDVSIQVDYLSRGHINNGISLVCHADEDLTSWFEVRVSSTSDYSFFRYDKKLREEEGKNPYVQLGKGKIDFKELYPSKKNTILLTCAGEELILDVNNGKRVISQLIDSPLDGQFVGIGAMSYDIVPINIDFDNITIRQE